ncbi:hypothetical protein [Paenibacillus sp. 1A_MP2]|uniref:hypothetical protein n=1 Tax=Paenibacillus sp. 1A_MP2 TaxID=3457495 RepID=UPI003FCC5B08
MSREVWLSWNNNAERLRLPVNPPDITIGNGSQTTTVDVAGIGEVAIINDPVLKTFEFSSFFPLRGGLTVNMKIFPSLNRRLRLYPNGRSQESRFVSSFLEPLGTLL